VIASGRSFFQNPEFDIEARPFELFKTLLGTVDMQNPVKLKKNNFARTVARACRVLQAGGVIAYPTETLYGLGALVSRKDAVARLRCLKGKREPMLVLVSGLEMAKRYAEIDERVEALAGFFWPGPLTLILKSRSDMLIEVCGAGRGVGMRVSSDLFAEALVQAVDEPLISTSANRTGQKTLKTGEDIVREFGTELDLIVDAGPRPGKASTVLDLSGAAPVLIREGRIKFSEIKRVFKWPE
jgi:L-threonylcarbamoyladenylate synthase